jgi:arylsulfatase A-like enzyme
MAEKDAEQARGPRAFVEQLVRALASWSLALGVVVGGLGFVVDAAIVATREPKAAGWLPVGLGSSVLGALLGLIAAPPIAAFEAAQRRLARRGIPRPLLLVPTLVLAGWVASRTLNEDVDAALPARNPGAYALIVVGFAAAMGVLQLLWTRAFGARARLAAVMVAVAALAGDLLIQRMMYRDCHDLAALVTVAGVLVAVRPAHRALARASASRLCAGLGLLLAALLGVAGSIESHWPGWRATATRSGHYMPRVAHAFRLLVDFDGDGFSPIAWGGDCDDSDPSRNPNEHESVPGRDANCNGIALPAHPTDADRGLLPERGQIGLRPGAIDRVVLVTIDCWRTDALRPEVMPNVARLAERGLVLTRAYAAGSSTMTTLPLLHRGFDRGATTAQRLHEFGIDSTAIVAFYLAAPEREPAAAGFTEVEDGTGPKRLGAAEVTDSAIAALRATEGQRHYLWLHYSDAHTPYPDVPKDVPAPRVDYAVPAYLRRLAYVDREVGRLVAELEATGALARTALVLTADHGEALGAHGIDAHVVSTFEPIVHVPAVVVAPGITPGRYDGLVSHRDLPATILGAFGLPAAQDAEVFGRSWLRLRAEPRPELHRFVIVRSFRTFTVRHGPSVPTAGIIEGNLKLSKTFEDGVLTMFDLAADADEQRDLVESRRTDADKLEHDLELYRDLDEYP